MCVLQCLLWCQCNWSLYESSVSLNSKIKVLEWLNYSSFTKFRTFIVLECLGGNVFAKAFDLMVLKRLVLYGEHIFTGPRSSSSAGTEHLLGHL